MVKEHLQVKHVTRTPTAWEKSAEIMASTLVSKVPFVKSSFEWKDTISPDGWLCQKNFELHCENGAFYHFAFEMKHIPHKSLNDKEHRNVELKLKMNLPIEQMSFGIVIKK